MGCCFWRMFQSISGGSTPIYFPTPACKMFLEEIHPSIFHTRVQDVPGGNTLIYSPRASQEDVEHHGLSDNPALVSGTFCTFPGLTFFVPHLPGTYNVCSAGTCPALARHSYLQCPALARHLPGTHTCNARHLPGTCPALAWHFLNRPAL